MKLVFAYDLDGTLLRKDNTIHPDTLKALEEVELAGHVNVIATGRGLKKVLPLIKDGTIQFVDYIVCSNGALIYDVYNDKTTVLNTVPNKVFYILKDKAIENDLILTVDTIDYNGSYLPNNQFPKWMSKEQIMDMNILNIATLEHLEKVVLNKESVITQIALRNPIEKAKEITDSIREATKDLPCVVYLTNSVYTDVNPENISKIVGVREVLKMLNLTEDNLVAFGDSGNDVAMIEAAKFGVALGNATKDAKAVADLVIDDHQTATIGHTLLKIINEDTI
ncbi:Cof-type HAD-IIB family hydrolase [Mycoplasma seminis]|uniref:Cof-type HAD-IIB family hydrolase n=1 Tax=Mycoplasma seminis TaxID=512749 RepID=A0ABY9HAE6_9MOLU|nr:Cof-type HAD-IIB family hydrolase [Mycoplasma seminis]WLP85567.1 Cof-type HAD-IIB family hydrolase [Mycoplasma seminis]